MSHNLIRKHILNWFIQTCRTFFGGPSYVSAKKSVDW